MRAVSHKPARALRFAAAVFVTVAVLGAAPAGAFSILGLKNRLVEFLLDQISTPGAFEVVAERVEEPADGVTSLIGVTVADGDGVWLTVETVSFSWNPGRLLRGEVEIASLAISGLSVTRGPTPLPEEVEEAEEDEGGFSFDWPRSPITIRVDQLTLERIHLAEGVAPQEIRFDATGAARDEGDVQALKLDITRTDEVEGTIALDYERNFAGGRFRLLLDAREAPGGMVAAAAGLAPDVAARVSLNADGPPEDWRLALDAHVDRMLDASGTARISYAGPLSAVADFSFTPGPDMGEAAQVAFAPSATLKVDAGEGEDGLIDIRAAEIASPALSLVADGTWNRGNGALDLSLVFAAEQALADLAEGVDFTRIGFDGRAQGAPDDLALTGEFSLVELVTAPAEIANLTLDAEVRKTGELIAVTGTGLAEGMRLDQLQPETLGAARLTLNAALEGDSARLTALNLDSAALNLAVEGGADLAAETLEVRYRVDAPDLGPVAGDYGVEAEGVFAATGAAAGTFSAPRVDGELALTGARLAGRDFGALTVTHELAMDETLTAEVAAAFRGSEFGDADFNAEAELDGETLAAHYALTAEDLAPAGVAIGTPLAGALTAEGEAKGPTSALALSGEARIENAAAAGVGLGRVALTHAVALREAISGDVKLAVSGSDYGDAEVATGFSLAGETLRVEGLRADAAGLSADGEATVNLATSTVEGGLRALGELDGLGRALGTRLGGVLQAEAKMSAPGGKQGATLAAAIDGLRTDGARVENIDLTASARDLLNTPALTAKLAVVNADAGDLEFETLTLDADGPLSALRLTLATQGEAGQNELTADAGALIDASGPKTRATIESFAVQLDEERAELSAPLVITAGGGTTTIEGLDLSLPDEGRLSGEAALLPNGASGDIELRDLSMASLRRMGLNVFDAGTTDFTARFDTRPGPAFAEIRLVGENLRRAGALNPEGKAITLDAQADWDGRVAQLNAGLVGPYKRPLTARATLPLRPTGALLPAPPRGAEIDAALDWNGRIENIWSLVPATGHILRGETDLALTVTGPLEAPHIGGRAEIRDGAYENLDLGTILTDLSVETTIAQGRDIGLNLSATDGASGRVTAQASVALSGPNEGLDVKLGIESAVLVRRDDVRARLDGDISVAGPLADILVNGEIEIEGAEVRLVNSSPPGVASLGEVHIKGEEPPDIEDEDPGLVTLDLRIFADRKIFVRGRGLESEWRADLKVSGPATEPLVVGSVERVRGTLDLLGRKFSLERGAATFTGPSDPALDVTLTRETDDFIGRIVVTGTGSEPAIAFTSDPVVPEEEVLPQAIFGRSSQSLSAAEGLQLALGVAQLLDGGDGALGNIRGAIGVDVLSLDTADDGEQELNVGSYVTEGVYVGAKQSLGGSSAVVVEIDLLDNLTMDVETGATTGESVGLNWKYDF